MPYSGWFNAVKLTGWLVVDEMAPESSDRSVPVARLYSCRSGVPLVGVLIYTTAEEAALRAGSVWEPVASIAGLESGPVSGVRPLPSAALIWKMAFVAPAVVPGASTRFDWNTIECSSLL